MSAHFLAEAPLTMGWGLSVKICEKHVCRSRKRSRLLCALV